MTEMKMGALQITTNLLAQSVRAHRESRGFSLGALAEVDGRSHRITIHELHLPAQVTYRSLAHLPGTQEFILCLQGDIRLGPEGREVQLQPGDTVWFSADLSHTYTSTSGAKALLVMKYPPAQGILP